MMGYAEDEFFNFLRHNMGLMRDIDVKEVLYELRPVFTISTMEELDRHLDREGNENTLWKFIMDLKKRDNWVNRLLEALWKRDQKELFYQLKEQYKSYNPKTVYSEPSSSPHSLPPLPSNSHDAAQEDSPPRYNSLQARMPPMYEIAEMQARPSRLPPSNQVQPNQDESWNYPSQESSEPATPPRPPQGNASAQPPAPPNVSSPTEMDQGATGYDDISKTPTRETQPFHSAPFMVSEDLEKFSASSLPARHVVEATQRVQQQPTNQVVTRSPVHYQADSPTTHRHEVRKTGTEPKQQEPPPLYPQERTSPRLAVDQCIAASEPERSSPEQVVRPKVISPPEQRLPTGNTRSGGNAEPDRPHRGQPAFPTATGSQSSCRPLDSGDTGTLVFSKPGELSPMPLGRSDEVSLLSREPELQISVDSQETNSSPSRAPASSQPPDTRSSHGSPLPPLRPPSSSTPTWSPEENDERGADDGLRHRRPANASPSHEPEENSFEVSFADLSDVYKFQYSERPPAELLEGNNPQERRSPGSSNISETVSGKKVQEEKIPKTEQSNLENPVVLSLTMAVVCLTIYIIWLKIKK